MRKIVYFDENSATDYLTILNGGTLLISDSEEEKIGDKAEIKAGAKLKVLFNSLFVSGSANLDSNIGAYTSGENFIKTTISNTALSDFVEVVSEPDSDISCMKGYSIYIMPNSIAYFQTITPYLAMTEGQIHVDGDLAINMNKMYDTLRLGKGYYELLAIKRTEKAIFRFNNEAFKNNYGISDLLQMNLCFYGVEVGKGKPDQFDFSKMFTDEGKVLTDFEQVVFEKEANEPLPIYDIILAGVE